MMVKQRDFAQPIAGITTSLGVAQYQTEEQIQDFIGRADAALYQAKQSGRKRTEIAN